MEMLGMIHSQSRVVLTLLLLMVVQVLINLFSLEGVSTNKSNFVVLNNVDSGDTLDLVAFATDITEANSTKLLY